MLISDNYCFLESITLLQCPRLSMGQIRGRKIVPLKQYYSESIEVCT